MSEVALRPKTMPRGSAPSRSASAARHSVTTCSARRSDGVTVPRLEMALVRVSATARADDVGGLAAAGAVEVRGPLGERGEVGTDRGDVERHTGILPQPSAPGVTTFPPHPGTFTSAPHGSGADVNLLAPSRNLH